MKLSKGFWQTYKEAPKDAQVPSHVLMMRAGLIHKAAMGLYNYLPMGLKALQKVEQIIREEHDKADCQEVAMSVVTPSELWKESGRWDTMGPELLRFKDRGDRENCLSPTNEEAVVDIFRSAVKSYKQLPQTLYQINTKYRDEIRPRYGVMRSREFLMKDAYSFNMDKDSLDKTYDVMFKVYENIFNRLNLEFIAVEADAGAMGTSDSKTHEFQVLAPTGEDSVINCTKCKYAANLEKASSKRDLKADNSSATLEKVETPNKATIEDVCKFLGLPEYTSLKSLVYFGVKGEKEFAILLLLLGDDQLNELKLVNHLKIDHVRAATDSEILNLEMEKGYIGPVGLKQKVKIMVDSAVNVESAFVAGANEKDMHFKGCVPKRDIERFDHVDFRQAKAGDSCPECGGSVEEIKGIEVGHIFQLGNKYTKAMNVKVLDRNGKGLHPLMGCYGIGVSRVVAAAIEQNCDENGIVWPAAIAPYHVYFGVIGKSDEIKSLGNDIYKSMKEAGIEVLYDDRGVGPGFMFKDSDLLGLPIRVVLGERDYNKDQLIEIKLRKSGESFKVTRDQLNDKIQSLLSTSSI